MTHTSEPRGFRWACQLAPGHDGEHEADFGRVAHTTWEPPEDGIEDPEWDVAEARAAFYCLALVGLAVAVGELLQAADQFVAWTTIPSEDIPMRRAEHRLVRAIRCTR